MPVGLWEDHWPTSHSPGSFLSGDWWRYGGELRLCVSGSSPWDLSRGVGLTAGVVEGVAPPEKGVVTSSVVRSQVSVEGEGAVLFSCPESGWARSPSQGENQGLQWHRSTLLVEGGHTCCRRALGLSHHFTPTVGRAELGALFP